MEATALELGLKSPCQSVVDILTDSERGEWGSVATPSPSWVQGRSGLQTCEKQSSMRWSQLSELFYFVKSFRSDGCQRNRSEVVSIGTTCVDDGKWTPVNNSRCLCVPHNCCSLFPFIYQQIPTLERGSVEGMGNQNIATWSIQYHGEKNCNLPVIRHSTINGKFNRRANVAYIMRYMSSGGARNLLRVSGMPFWDCHIVGRV